MKPDTDSRTAELFEAALDMEPVERAAFLDRACAGDSVLRARVESLIATDAEAEGFLVPPGRDVDQLAAPPSPADPLIGAQIGRYRVIGVIASGGMGTVYEAMQEEPKRRVALKVVRAGLTSRTALHRFRHEAQILSRLRHPGIAQIFEADSYGGSGGVPYFVMEYIDGARTITQYARDERLSTTERLMLFATVCDAIQHGHRRGIIHRDLKPGNILVDASGHPKIIDFGVARATDADMTVATMQTDVGGLVGTLRYMSPEQCDGDSAEIDTRCDIYALGVVLYELLTGEFPYDLSSSSPFEAPRVIREVQPRRLSSIHRNLRGDVETVVLKALEKDREYRYQSAAELGADIQHVVRGEPIEAKRDSLVYTLRKNISRHRRVAAVAIVFVALLAAFGIVSAIQAERNRRLASDERTARQEAVEALRLATREQERADAASAQLQRELTASNIDRGRLFGQTGNLVAAENLLWREHLQHPESTHSHWALWELYSRNPSLASVPTDGKVYAVAYAPDGSLVAASGDDAVITLRDPIMLERMGALRGHADAVQGLAFSPDGQSIASASLDGTVRIWDLASKTAIRVLREHSNGVRVVKYALDGRHLVSGADDATIRVWSTITGECVNTLQGHTSAVTQLCFSTDGSLLASGSDDRTIRLWRSPRGPGVAVLTGHTRELDALAFSPDSRILASGSRDKVIKLWDLGTHECVETIPAANGTIRFLSFSTDGGSLITGGWWRIDAWNIRRRFRRQLQSHGVGGADISPDGHLLTAYFDGCLRVSDIGDDAGILRLGGGSTHGRPSVNPDGRLIASGAESGTVSLWETLTGKRLAALPPHTAHLSSCHFGPLGTLLATCYEDGVVKLWDLTTGDMVNSFDGNQTATRYSLSFTPDGEMLASTRLDGTIQIRQVPTFRITATIPAAQTEILSVRFSPDGRTLAATYRRGHLHLYTADGDLAAALDTVGPAWTVAFSPDGERLALACWWTMPIQVWNLRTQTRELLLEEPKAAVWEVAYMPGNPNILASASSDGTVQFWDIAGQRNILTLDPFERFDATSVSFTPDGKTLVATGGDGSLCVWDLEYFERHIAGNLNRQTTLLRPELGDAIQTEHLNAWAKDIAHRPWPRVGPHAERSAVQRQPVPDLVGVEPEVIAAWGAHSGRDSGT